MNSFITAEGILKPADRQACSFGVRFAGLFLLSFLSLALASNVALAIEVSMPLASNLEADSKIVAGTKTVIILYFSAPDCVYCMKLEKAVLEPMLRSGDYDEQVLLRKIDWRSAGQVNDFSGRRVSLNTLADHYEVKVTPTLVFVDAGGREVAPRILGFRSADFFWYYLDQRIDLSGLQISGESR
ncbi:MAG: thioredoxin fold domain-containing protein [Gammaproteobacteria bacterium]|nr:thioredoxin fold domain-containing protein [Gammaproteobacteria bacterium]MBQ0839481.1 thioredoxin fold domain-containing protein [Gammaproteobacteria bacterium]